MEDKIDRKEALKMDRQISLQAAIATLESDIRTAKSEDGEIWVAKINAQQKLSMLPSAQPEIIRCKECKYAHLTHEGDVKFCDAWTDDDDYLIELYLDGDFYCGHAERREE